ncbi:hypothetical protein K435DRAFT_808036 [Dendrothele bispora CBS 962.96]|uniref:Uncharacterized protein n=1 Tax=Dendrothele bispora (strain CBS 962.96) TaxID=1314807 RepID=A0A4S8L2T3_DENBC|nr:hypothetical protein K435DRAFT_808036 [Dendrothele bispora CBS 962.96]
MVPPQVLIQQAVLPQQLLDQQFVILQTRVSKGRPARSQPMQPYRATSRRKVLTQFQAKPGPKGERIHPLSLLHKGPAHLQAKEAKERVNFFLTYELVATLTEVKAQGIKNLQMLSTKKNTAREKIPLKPEPKHKLDQIKELGSVSHPQVRQQLLRGPEPAGFENDEIEALFEKNVNRWNGADYFLRQDEMVGFTDLLNGLAVSKGSNCLFLANEYQTLGQRLIECGPDHSTDELEILKPEWFGPGTIYAQLIHYTTHFLSKPTSIHFFHLDNSKAHWVLFKVSSKSFKIDLFDSLSDGDWDEIVDIDSEEGMVAIASHFSGLQNYTQASVSNLFRLSYSQS